MKKTIIVLSLIFIGMIAYLVLQSPVEVKTKSDLKGTRTTKTSPFVEFQISGSETWNISGKDYLIEGTKIITFPSGDFLYAVIAIVDHDMALTRENPLPKELAQEVINKGYWDKASEFLVNGEKVKLSEVVGVALVKKSTKAGGNLSRNQGYRYQVPLSELKLGS